MTKKEKKELALQIKAETEAKKPRTEKKEIISKEQKEKYNHRKHLQQKAKNRKNSQEVMGLKYPKHWDLGEDWYAV